MTPEQWRGLCDRLGVDSTRFWVTDVFTCIKWRGPQHCGGEVRDWLSKVAEGDIICVSLIATFDERLETFYLPRPLTETEMVLAKLHFPHINFYF